MMLLSFYGIKILYSRKTRLNKEESLAVERYIKLKTKAKSLYKSTNEVIIANGMIALAKEVLKRGER